ncbi:MAG: hypothetical protein AB8H03_14535 [Saprospiraceae bacterium]
MENDFKFYTQDKTIESLEKEINDISSEGYRLKNILPLNAKSWRMAHLMSHGVNPKFLDVTFKESENSFIYKLIQPENLGEFLEENEDFSLYQMKRPNYAGSDTMAFNFDDEKYIVFEKEF